MWWTIFYIVGWVVAYTVARAETKVTHPDHYHTGQAIVARIGVAFLSWLTVAIWLLIRVANWCSKMAEKEWPKWL